MTRKTITRNRACDIVLELMDAKCGEALLELDSFGEVIKSKADVEVFTRFTVKDLSWFIGARDAFHNLFGESHESTMITVKTNQIAKGISKHAQEIVKEKMKEFELVRSD